LATEIPGSSPSRTLGLLAAALAAVCAAGLALVAAANQSPGPSAVVPWPVVFGALLGAPAVIGGLGAISGRRSLLVAAGVLCLAQSVLSFSGVTLVLLLPALVFLRAAVTTRAAPAPQPRPGEPVRALRWVALTALAVPVAFLAVQYLGVFGIVGLVALAALTPALLRRAARRVTLGDALVGIAIVGLVLAAMYSALANTQTVCWNARSTPAGIVYERIPAQEEGPVELDSGIVSSGCSGGQPTIEGTALTAIFLVGAIAIAAQTALTRRDPAARAGSRAALPE
jgi:hypothetical protein